MKFNSLMAGACMLMLLSACNGEAEKTETESTVNEEAKPSPNLAEFEKMSWMAGTWSATFPDQSVLTESWTKVNDTTLNGETHLVGGRDTFFTDKPNIVVKDGEVHYVANVAGENEGKSVYFKAVSSEKGNHVFENKAHDYPQRITYQMKSDTILYAKLEGMEKGKPKTEEFEMYKMK